ncbi:hypothetical protein RFI_24274, partial [Reticulomyxa filosa]
KEVASEAYTCHWCRQEFLTLDECDQHQMKIHRYQCIHCEQKIAFLTRVELQHHKEQQHAHLTRDHLVMRSVKDPFGNDQNDQESANTLQDKLVNPLSHFLVMQQDGTIAMTSQTKLRKDRLRSGKGRFHDIWKRLDQNLREESKQVVAVAATVAETGVEAPDTNPPASVTVDATVKPIIVDVKELRKDAPLVNTRSFAKKQIKYKKCPWTQEETCKFYDCLSQCGMDFNLMAILFRSHDHVRTPRELKIKFDKEEQFDPQKINSSCKKPNFVLFSSKFVDDVNEQLQKEKNQKQEEEQLLKAKEQKKKQFMFDPTEYLDESTADTNTQNTGAPDAADENNHHSESSTEDLTGDASPPAIISKRDIINEVARPTTTTTTTTTIEYTPRTGVNSEVVQPIATVLKDVAFNPLELLEDYADNNDTRSIDVSNDD